MDSIQSRRVQLPAIIEAAVWSSQLGGIPAGGAPSRPTCRQRAVAALVSEAANGSGTFSVPDKGISKNS
ncbi:hypothetical protein [Rhodanobacter terrae]|uniref:Uncharacterized protein n=1 Tax=Rhodanobacter terrae TaxID=418647 RepID=A0ABW0T1I8_9GAMM